VGCSDSAEGFRESRPESYDDLQAPLDGLADKHAKEIDVLHEYVRWLSTRDVMAPKILFTYRVWGSSRMAKRWINGDAGVAGLEETSVNRREGKHVRIEESADFA
jgi:hypothetical protein